MVNQIKGHIMEKVTAEHMHLVEHILNDGWVIYPGDTEPHKPDEHVIDILRNAKPHYSPEQQEIKRLQQIINRQQEEITKLAKTQKAKEDRALHRFLNKEEVDAIIARLQKGELGSYISRDLGVASSVISKIKTGQHKFNSTPVVIQSK
jgi:hypothetical protein